MNKLVMSGFVPMMIKKPRTGVLGKLLDRFLWPRYVSNPHAYAGCFVVTDEENNQMWSANGIEWHEANYADIITGEPRSLDEQRSMLSNALLGRNRHESS